MFSHVTLGSNDLAKSKKFYDAVLGAIGAEPGAPAGEGRLIYMCNDGMLLITTPIDGKTATHANGGTIGFTMETSAQADNWHDAGVKNGGKSIEDPPGVRESEFGNMYLAYLRDPDGNKLCALHRMG